MIRNPILPGFNPDPSIVRVGDDFYIATSTFEWYPGVQIHHSRDLKHWRLAARPLNRAALLDMRGNPDSGGVWAPCLSWHDGLFYLVYTDVKRLDPQTKDTHNYVTTCATIDGEWSDPVYLNSSGFDPSMFHDEDGRHWLVNMIWDTRHGRNRFGGIYLQEYDAEAGCLLGEAVNIFRGSDLGYTEAPHLYFRDGWYYLLTAEGGTGYTHAMTMARSRQITGPYEVDPNGYLLTAKDARDRYLQRTGHGDLVDTPAGEHYLVHLCGRPIEGLRRCPLGRETGLQRFRWTEDGWPRLENNTGGDGLPEAEVPEPQLPEHPWPEQPSSHDFKSAELPEQFQWLRTPYPERFMSLTERPGYLRLTGRESPGSFFDQALVARRQEAFKFRAETVLEFAPGNFQQMAGLICYYNSQKFHYLLVSIDEQGRRFIDVMSCQGHPEGEWTWPLREGHTDPDSLDPAFRLANSGPVWLRADVDHQVLKFSWSEDGENWKQIPAVLDYSLVSDEAGKGEGASFTGAFVGMACHDLSGAGCPADFGRFEYIEKE